MNTRRTIGQRRGGAAGGGNLVPPQALAEEVSRSVNLAVLTDPVVLEYLAKIEQVITMQA